MVSAAPLRAGHGQSRGDGGGESLQRHFDVDLSTQKNSWMSEISYQLFGASLKVKGTEFK